MSVGKPSHFRGDDGWVRQAGIEGSIDRVQKVCGSERLTGAMLDRLTHKVHIIEANGQSYRLEQSRKRLARHKKIER